jgi:GcrA cell cycle regulator
MAKAPEQRVACSWQSAYKYPMSWDATDVALLKKLWAYGHSAGQIASRLGYSRNAVSAKLKRMGQKRGRKPPTASPKIVSVPKRKPALLAGCAISECLLSCPKIACVQAQYDSLARTVPGHLASRR